MPTTSVDEVYTQVIGLDGRVQGYGFGHTPTSIFGSTSKRQLTTDLAKQLEHAEKKFQIG